MVAKKIFTFEETSPGQRLLDKGWSRKSAFEAYLFSMGVAPWLQGLEDQHGKLKTLLHADDGDDPPDILGQFERQEVGFEVTELKPSTIGHFNSVVKKLRQDYMTVTARLTGPSFSDHKTMEAYALNIGGVAGWCLVEDEAVKWVEEAWTMLMKKVIRARSAKYSYVIMLASPEYETYTEIIAYHVDRAIRASKDEFPNVILHSQANPYRYVSWLIAKGNAMQSASVTP